MDGDGYLIPSGDRGIYLRRVGTLSVSYDSRHGWEVRGCRQRNQEAVEAWRNAMVLGGVVNCDGGVDLR